MVDFTTYQPPGVYVEDTTGPVVTTGGVPLPLVAVVGPARGYQVITEAVEIGEEPTALSNRGVWQQEATAENGLPAGVKAPVVRNVAGDTLAAENYALTVNTGSGTGSEATTEIEIGALTDGATTGGVAPGDVVFVTYYFTDAAYYTPRVFEDFDKVVEAFGEPLVTQRPAVLGASQVVSPLSLAARLVFDNGATSVICLPTDPTPDAEANVPDLRTQLVAAYDKIETNYNAAIIVPIYPGTDGSTAIVQNIATDLRNHVVNATNEGYGRLGFVGVPAEHGSNASDTGLDGVARTVKHKRIALAYPNRLSLYNGALNLTTEVDGFYFAAACAGRMVGNNVAQGLTRQSIFGFAGLPASVQKLQTRSFKDNLSKWGVLVAEQDRQGRFIVRHGLSTDTASVLTRELSITRARDYLFEALQIGLDNSGLIGAPIDPEMTIRVKGAIESILIAAQSRGVFVNYTDIQVRRQALPNGDPSIIEAKFAYQPAVPLNYIKVSFSIDLSTGSTVFAAA